MNLAPTTLDIIKSALRSDPNISPPERKRLFTQLKQGSSPTVESGPPCKEDRILRREEAARRLSCSTRMIDRLAAEGILRKRRLPGRVRAHGISESELLALFT